MEKEDNKQDNSHDNDTNVKAVSFNETDKTSAKEEEEEDQESSASHHFGSNKNLNKKR